MHWKEILTVLPPNHAASGVSFEMCTLGVDMQPVALESLKVHTPPLRV